MGELIDVNSETWKDEVLSSTEPVLVDFWHDACIWCKRLEPELREVAKEFSGKLKFARFNILSSEANQKLGDTYGVMGTPTLILFCNGRVLQELVGYRPKTQLKSELQEMDKTYESCLKQSTPVQPYA